MLTKKELTILNHLRSNARKPFAEISREANIPLSTVFDRVNKLERNIITKHTSLVDFKKLGYFIRVFYGIKAKDKYSFLNFINDHSNVNNLCVCANNHDFFFEILFKNTSKMYDFFETLNEHCENVDTYHVIEDLKREDLFLQNHIN